MSECVKELHRKQEKLLKIEVSQRSRIALSLHPVDWGHVKYKVEQVERTVFSACRERHLKKYACLITQSPPSKNNQGIIPDKDNFVNISSKTLTIDEKSLLNKGLKYIPTSTKTNTLNIIAQVELAMSQAKLSDDTLPGQIKRSFRNNPKERNNLSKGEKQALENLKRDESIVIMPSDKGGVTVIMDKTDYETKLDALVYSSSYTKLKKDPTLKIDREIRNIATRVKKEKNQPSYIIHKIIGHESRLPSIFGSLKIHKENFPLRPILSNFATVTENAGRYVKNILDQFVTEHNKGIIINNIKELKVNLSKLDCNISDCLLASFDIVNMYGSIDTHNAHKIISKLVKEDKGFRERFSVKPNDFLDLLKIVLNNSYFTHKGEFFLQTEGLPMGNAVSGTIAELVVLDLESKFPDVEGFPNLIKYFRYRDDSFVLWDAGLERLKKFHEGLNNLDTDIKFTIEIEKNGTLPFLDALIIRTHSGISFSSYSKPYSSNLILNYNAFHDTKVINSVVKGETSRILNLSDSPEEDLAKLKTKFIQNSYPASVINKNMKAAENKFRKGNPKPAPDNSGPFLKLKYTGKKSLAIQRKAKNFNIKTVFQKQNNLANMFAGSYKTSTTVSKGVVYEIKCFCGGSYIGETGGDVSKRAKEHKADIRRLDLKNSLAFHSTSCDSGFDWQNIKILHHERNWKLRKLKESILIQKHKPALNLKDGMVLAGKWY